MAEVAETTLNTTDLSSHPLTPAFRKDGQTVQIKNMKLDGLTIGVSLSVPTSEEANNAASVEYVNNKISTEIATVNQSISKINSTLKNVPSSTEIDEIRQGVNTNTSTLRSISTTLNSVKEKVDGLVDGNNTGY